jgi:Tol biopolymer transport system component
MSTSSRLGPPPFVRAIVRSIAITILLLCFAGCSSTPSSLPVGTPGTLVFTSNRALDGTDAAISGVINVWTVKTDGTGARPLTQLTSSAYPGANRDPVWSPDGSKIVYSSGSALDGSDASNGAYGTLNIWVVNADGTGATPLTRLTAAQMDCRAPAWSADGKRIAYYSARAFDGSDTISANPLNIWTMNADGSNDAPLTQLTAAEANSRNPHWSPDGTKVAFESQRSLDGSNVGFTASNIWVVNADGSGAVAITQEDGTIATVYAQDVIWSKDGSKLAFTIMPNNIWTAHPDGSGLTALTNLTASMNFANSWSPDGTKLVFSSNRAVDGSDNFQEQSNVWVMNADGSNAKSLTRLTKASADGGVWSPDGTRVAYGSDRALDGSDAFGMENIWIVTADGSSTAPVTRLVKAVNYLSGWQP